MTYHLLEAPDDLWSEWKDTVPRSMNLNDAIIELIRDDLNQDD